MQPKYLLAGILTSAVAACGGGTQALPEASTPYVPQQASMSSPVAVTPPKPAEKPAPPAPTSAKRQSLGSAPRQALNDEQIAAVTDAANTGEIDQARIAERKARNVRVKKFAEMMIAHHTQAKEDQSELLRKVNVTEVDNPKSAAVRGESQRAMEMLEVTTDSAFDRAYIDLQVNEHEEMLNSIDSVLIPNAKNADLKAALQDLRPRIAAHLQEARDIQQMLETTPPSVG